MALTGIQIFKLLPKTNCKECGVPTCLAFAMNLASGKAELDSCPYVSDEARAQLAEASAECGWRSFQIMAGTLDRRSITPELLSYEGPFGVG